MSNLSMRKTSKKTKNQKKSKSNNSNQTLINSSPLIYYNDPKAYEILDMWNGITNLTLNDFPKVLEMVNISLPITINLCDYHASKLFCVDKDNVPFTITFKFHCFSNSKLFIEFENESFMYDLNNNSQNETKEIKLTLIEHVIRTFAYSNEIYTFTFDSRKNMIIQTLLVNGNEFIYTVEYKLLNEEKYEVLDKILKNKKLANSFENLKSSHALLKNIINNLNLTNDELQELAINITFTYCDVIFSKINLYQNEINELSFTTDNGYHNLYNSGKLIFTSGDKNITFVVNDISKCFNQKSICIEEFNSILEYANTMFAKIKNNYFLNND